MHLPLLNFLVFFIFIDYTVLVNKQVLKDIFEGKVSELMQNTFLACAALRALEQL